MKYIIVFIYIFQSFQNVATIDIIDVSKDTSITVESSVEYPASAKVEFEGTVDDTFQINNGKLPGGKIDTFYHFDCYEQIFRLKYTAYKAKKGRLKITARF